MSNDRASVETRIKRAKQSKQQYEKRKAAGLCTYCGCPAKPEVGRTRCPKHLVALSKKYSKRCYERIKQGVCIYCGLRPPFWGLRCLICRQIFAKDPLPSGARRALRQYRLAETRRKVEQFQAQARTVIHDLLASGQINGKCAEVLRLYSGLDTGEWRTYAEVGYIMSISKERVRQLLHPSRVIMAQLMGDRVPRKSEPEDLKQSSNESSCLIGDTVRCCNQPNAIFSRPESQPYEALSHFILVDVPVYHCDSCKSETVLIPRRHDLENQVARNVLLKPASLSGRELRFLRAVARLTIEHLAELVRVTPHTLIAWEGSSVLGRRNDIAARVVLSMVISRDSSLILEILNSIQIGKTKSKPIIVRWVDAQLRWVIESADS